MKIDEVKFAISAVIALVVGFSLHSIFCLLSPELFLKMHANLMYITDPGVLTVKFTMIDFAKNLGFVSVAGFIMSWMFAYFYNLMSKES